MQALYNKAVSHIFLFVTRHSGLCVLSPSNEANMRLQPVSLRSRRFRIQFEEIMSEFGEKIPWLRGLDELRFATNRRWFQDQLLQRLGQHGAIIPYQFVEENSARASVGGVLFFGRSPETMRDPRNVEIAERLEAGGAYFASCLQVREVSRGMGVGSAMMPRAIRAIQNRHGTAVWGVVSDPRLLSWYASLGAETPSPTDNKDGLWIVHWPRFGTRPA